MSTLREVCFLLPQRVRSSLFKLFSICLNLCVYYHCLLLPQRVRGSVHIPRAFRSEPWPKLCIGTANLVFIVCIVVLCSLFCFVYFLLF